MRFQSLQPKNNEEHENPRAPRRPRPLHPAPTSRSGEASNEADTNLDVEAGGDRRLTVNVVVIGFKWRLSQALHVRTTRKG